MNTKPLFWAMAAASVIAIIMSIMLIHSGFRMADLEKEYAVFRATAINYPDSLDDCKFKLKQLQAINGIWVTVGWTLLKYEAGDIDTDSTNIIMQKYFGGSGNPILKYWENDVLKK